MNTNVPSQRSHNSAMEYFLVQEKRTTKEKKKPRLLKSALLGRDSFKSISGSIDPMIPVIVRGMRSSFGRIPSDKVRDAKKPELSVPILKCVSKFAMF